MSKTSTLAITTALFLGLTWATLFVRAWVRIKLVKKVGIDDKWMVAAQVQIPLTQFIVFHADNDKILYTAFTTMTLIGTHYGFGKHTNDLSPENYMLALKVSLCFVDTSPAELIL